MERTQKGNLRLACSDTTTRIETIPPTGRGDRARAMARLRPTTANSSRTQDGETEPRNRPRDKRARMQVAGVKGESELKCEEEGARMSRERDCVAHRKH
jgi:hypothetical protein